MSDFIVTAQKVAEKDDVARKAKVFHKIIETYQSSMTSLELCKKPILAAIHSACIGGGVDLITAADIRYCTKDAWFQVKEVSLILLSLSPLLQELALKIDIKIVSFINLSAGAIGTIPRKEAVDKR